MNHPNSVPAARREHLVIEKTGDETLIYDLDRHDAHSLNQVAALVWHECDGTKSIAQLAALLPGELPTAEKEAAVCAALDQLAKAHLLTAPLTEPALSASRRDLLLKIGIGAIATIPLVVSINVPSAYAQGSPPSKGGLR
jgi:hypothetical protein